jgi:hypothetical protein
VAEVLFDYYGGIKAFVLDDCCERRPVESREQGVADLVLRACRENLTVCVRLCSNTSRIEGLAIGA